jgi:hypothetical protein
MVNTLLYTSKHQVLVATLYATDYRYTSKRPGNELACDRDDIEVLLCITKNYPGNNDNLVRRCILLITLYPHNSVSALKQYSNIYLPT